MKAERHRLEAVESQARLNCQREDEDRRQKILAKLQEMQQRQIRDHLKVISHLILIFGISQ